MGGLRRGAPWGSARERRRSCDMPRRRDDGYILLDVLTALFIVLIGFAVLLGGIGIAESTAVSRHKKALVVIEEKNGRAREHVTLFTRE